MSWIITKIKPIGYASRIFYNLRDYDEDITDVIKDNNTFGGLVNISKEDCLKFGITMGDLKNQHSPGVQKWLS